MAACATLALPAAAAATGTFKNPLLLPTSTNVQAVGAADVNGDGRPDLFYADGQTFTQATLHVLLGNGDGTFTHGQDILVPAVECCSIYAADVTGDGKVDLVMPSRLLDGPFEMIVLPGNGDGTFGSPVVSSITTLSSGGASLLGIGDIDEDGHKDVVVNQGGILAYLKGDGSGHFTLFSTLNVSFNNDVYLADLNGDHHLDLLVTDVVGARFAVALGNGDGTFQGLVTYTIATATFALVLTDVDGDGRPDMLTDYFQNQTGYFKGNGDGTFGPLTPIEPTPLSLSLLGAVDLTSDGMPDLVWATETGFGVQAGAGNLTFTGMRQTVSGNPPSFFVARFIPAVADFNMDGHPDFATPVEGGVLVLLGKGDGTFASADAYDLGQPVGAVAVADFNGDKNPDVAVTLPATFPRILLGNGQGGFALGPDPNSSYAADGQAVTAVAADFNGDGRADLSVGNVLPMSTLTIGSQSVLLGRGDGTFNAPLTVSGASPNIADLNKDGRSDMVSVSAGSIVSVLGQGGGGFTSVTTVLPRGNPNSGFALGDLNHDGVVDLALDYGDHLETWLGTGSGTFTYAVSTPLAVGGPQASAVIADVDGDGNGDLLLVTSDPAVAVFYGNGDGTFQAPLRFPLSRPYAQIVVADLDRDNKPDLVLSDGSAIAVMANLGGRKFDAEVDYVAGRAATSVKVVDVNGDGFPDIVAANAGGTTVAVLLNQPNSSAPDGAPVFGSMSVSPEPSVGPAPFTVALTVQPESTGSPTPTGSASFYIDGSFVGDAALTSGTATFVFSGTLTATQHAVVATYNGDRMYAPKSFAALHVVQPPTITTQTVLSVVPSPILASQTVRLTAAVTGSMPISRGLVTFFDGGSVLGAQPVDANGTAQHDTALLSAGVHSLSAQYQGGTLEDTSGPAQFISAIFAPSVSPAVALAVTANATTVALSPSNPSPGAGTVVTFTATVSSSAGVPFGGVSFFDGNTMLETLGLRADGTTAFSTASLSVGSHSISASFNANGPFAGGVSAPVAVSVAAAPAAAIPTVVALARDAGAGSSNWAATVVAPRGVPVGTVTLLDSGVIVGSATIDASGIAHVHGPTMAAGTHILTASFGGGEHFAPSVSPEILEQFPSSAAEFDVSLPVHSVRIGSAETASVQVIVSSPGAFGQTVQFDCAGLPEGYGGTFSPVALDGAGNSTLTIAPLSSAGTRSRVTTLTFGGLLVGCCVLGLLLSEGNGGSRLAALLAACVGAAVLAGCSMTSTAPAPARMSVVTVRAVSGSESQVVVHSSQVSLIIAGR